VSTELLRTNSSRADGGASGLRGAGSRAGRRLVAAGTRFADAEAYRLAASLSFYALSSVFPLMLLAISLGKAVLGDSESLQSGLISALDATRSPALRSLLSDTLVSVREARESNVWSIAIGMVASIFAASGMFLELDAAMSKIFQVPRASLSFWKSIRVTLHDRLTALALVVVTSLLLLCGTLLLTAAEAVISHIPLLAGHFPGMLAKSTALALTVVALGLCYRIVPGVPVAWRAAWIGAFAAGVALHAVRWPLAFLLAHVTNYGAYGVVGTLLLLLTWLYVAGSILLFGAALTATAQGTGLNKDS
jgi:membrane protein